MIASHLLAYFFTELNHDQVQKVSKPGRRRLARLLQSCVVPGPLPRVSAGLLDSLRTRFFPTRGGGRGKSLGNRETLRHEEPRPLGTSRRVRACEAPELALRALLPPCYPARARAFFLKGRVTQQVVLDCWAHVGRAPLSQPEFRPEHVGRVVAGGGGAAAAWGCWGSPA